jgi:hypothetical protein
VTAGEDHQGLSSVHADRAATVFGLDLEPGSGWEDTLVARLAPDTPEKSLGPLRKVMAVARMHGCRSIVLEHRYLDLDYRSEYTTFWSKRFEGRERVAQRMHFVRDEVHPGELHDLPEALRNSYIGYSVLRPTVLGPVGRTVLEPPPDFAGATLCLVRDEPSLFGNVLEVRGVPFCQQDGEVLICAHTAAWLCHYVAHGRNIIGRKTTAEIVNTPSVEGSRHRPVPSTGLTSEQLQGIFSTLGIPAFFYDVSDLPELPAEPEPPPGDSRKIKRAHKLRLRREKILRVVCKYLNSGFPVVVLTENASAHAFTLVGWRQEGEQIVLLGCDDQVGPYEEIFDPIGKGPGHRGMWKSLMIPLPEKVFLTGEAAETAAYGYVEVAVSGEGALEEDTDLSPGDADLSELSSKLAEGWKGPVSVRTRLIEGRKYKALLERQDRSPGVLRVLRLGHLPHWVWVVEFHDRVARDGGEAIEPCVLGEVVLDSTSHDDVPVIDLVATKSVAADAGFERETPGDPDAHADGDGTMWRSMISDPVVTSAASGDAPAEEQRRTASEHRAA